MAIEIYDIYIISILISMCIMTVIAIVYQFRSSALLSAIGSSDWKEIESHYKQIKYLKDRDWDNNRS
jgi:hypothetical protein